jgi:signal transduction histidine kinase
MLRRSIQATEDERGRWAHELRERTLTQLSRMREELSAARDDGASADDAIGHALSALGSQIDAVRWMITRLRPPQLDELGVVASLRALFEHADLTGLRVDCTADLAYESGRAETRLAPAIEVTVFRVAQEAVDNAIRHSGARVATVTLEEDGGEVRLSVRDEGCGFDAAAHSDGYGIVDMRERLALVGGALDVQSEPGRGTTLSARIPSRRVPSAAAGS